VTISSPPLTTPFQDAAGYITMPWVAWLGMVTTALGPGGILFNTALTGNTTIAALTAAIATITGAATFSTPAAIVFGAGWTVWTPVFTPSGAMTVTGVSVVTAKYLRVGPVVYLQMVFGLTLGGTLSNTLTISGLPVALADSGNGLTCWNASSVQPLSVQFGTSTSLTIQPAGAATFSGGAQFLTLGGVYHC